VDGERDGTSETPPDDAQAIPLHSGGIVCPECQQPHGLDAATPCYACDKKRGRWGA